MSDERLKLLVAVDGSEPSLKAVRRAIERAKHAAGAEIRLLNVQPRLPQSVADFVGKAAVDGFHAEEADKALAEARRLVEGSGVAHHTHWRADTPADGIVREAEEFGASEIIMGHHGLGRISGLFLGSVAQKVIELAKVPVTIVK